ncbi:MAG: 30S ribosomal protein S20 [Fastidiosipilaceae bacterium]|nr:30S ribosomal protein S20 [Clostridiaceae bacterium]
MPNIKSAIKRVGVNQRKREVNKKIKSNLRTVVKKAHLAIDEGSDKATEQVRIAQKTIDKACAKGILHKNTAARQKSQLQKKLTQ